MNKVYTIGEVAKITGVSKDRLRNYDKLNLLSPQKEDGNSYRKYRKKDIMEVLSIEHMRSMDLGMKDINAFHESGDIETLLQIIEKKQEEVRKKKESLIRIETCIQNTYDEVIRIKKILNKFVIREMLDFRIVGELSSCIAFDEYEHMRNISNEKKPIIKSFIRKITFERDEILSNQVLIIESSDMNEIMYERCLYTVVKENIIEGDILSDMRQKCINWLKEHNESPIGVVYVKPMLMCNEMDGLFSFSEIYVPLK